MVLKIKNLKLKDNLLLAPMEEITNLPFRMLCKKYGAGLVCAEMVHVNAISRNNKASLKRVKTSKEEKPVSMQMIGNRINLIKKSVKILEKKADVIDFNFGCPAINMVRNGCGASLLQRPKRMKEIIKTIKETTKKPVTAKIRIVKDEKHMLKIIDAVKEADAVIVHGRTLGQGYSGKASWKWIKFVKNNISSIPVIGNGDVCDKESYKKIQEQTKCDGVMVGRAAIGNPGIFSEILKGKKQDKFKMFNEFVKLYKKFKYDDAKILKQQAQFFTKGIVGGASIRRKLNNSKTEKEIFDVMNIRNI